MRFCRRWLLILSAFVLGSGQIFAAGGTREQRAYAAAVAAFQDGLWNRAETELEQFVQQYPKSTNVPEAVLLQAQAEFKQGKFPQTIALLNQHKSGAGMLADQYRYWIGEAQFQTGDFTNAAATFVSLTRDFSGSPLLSRGVVEAAAARAQLGQWPQVASLLEGTNSVFQRAVQVDSASEIVARGRLLLAQAKFAQNDFAGAAAVLALLNRQTLPPSLDWQRAHLLCQVKLAAGDLDAALAAATNLMQIARLEMDAGWRAESAAMHADVLEKMKRNDEAIAAYADNLSADAPVERQRQAVMKIAELAVAQNQFSAAEQSLEKFLAQFPDSPVLDVALLSLGELHLKEYTTPPAGAGATNHLRAAQARLDQFLDVFTNSPLAGKAHLDRGWCEWLAEDTTNSLADFETAARLLPPSEDRAVARFKTGDARFAQNDFAGALGNYRAALADFTNFPDAAKAFGDRALYQSLRASLKFRNLPGASNALAQILEKYPASDLAPASALLYGEGLADAHQPAAAREQFQRFELQFPNSPLRPQVEFDTARTHELEQDWPGAIAGYQGWLTTFPTNELRPQALYALAWVDSRAGNETEAFALFTNFVAQFPANDLAPRAQLWVADHFFRLGGANSANYADAEKNYELVYQNFPTNELAWPARMMAGRAAIARQGYTDANDYFTKLEADTNCPMDLRVQATFAHGNALMQMGSPDTNNPLANFSQAIGVFRQICQRFPTNEAGLRAWSEIGDCDLQLTNYNAALDAYARVFDTNSVADISARSRAQIGFGMALEKQAALTTGTNQTALLQAALGNYVDVLYEKNLRDNETADPFWVKKAGLQAAALAESLGKWESAADIYGRLKKWLPQLGDALDKKIAKANSHLAPKNN